MRVSCDVQVPQGFWDSYGLMLCVLQRVSALFRHVDVGQGLGIVLVNGPVQKKLVLVTQIPNMLASYQQPRLAARRTA